MLVTPCVVPLKMLLWYCFLVVWFAFVVLFRELSCVPYVLTRNELQQRDN